jgi:Zn-finger nucleic acid-binding protein
MEDLKCPQCEGLVMQKVESSRDKKVVLDVCPGCGNFWLDGGEIQAIQQDSLLVLFADAFRWSRQA